MVEKCLNRFLLLHLKYENRSENSKVGQENTDSVRLNTENDAVRFRIFPFYFHPYLPRTSVHGFEVMPPCVPRMRNEWSIPCACLTHSSALLNSDPTAEFRV
jgi:hypothetical protein